MFVFIQFINIFMVNGGMKKLEMSGARKLITMRETLIAITWLYSHKTPTNTLPETNSEFAPKNGWLEYELPFLLGETAYFQGCLQGGYQISFVFCWSRYCCNVA